MEDRKYYHYVFTTYRRRMSLKGAVKERLSEWFKKIAACKQFDIIALSILEDHVHLLIEQKSNDSAAYIMKSLKGGSSYRLFLNYPDINRLVFRKLWARSYCCRKIPENDLNNVVKYIHNQTNSLGVDKRFNKTN